MLASMSTENAEWLSSNLLTPRADPERLTPFAFGHVSHDATGRIVCGNTVTLPVVRTGTGEPADQVPGTCRACENTPCDAVREAGGPRKRTRTAEQARQRKAARKRSRASRRGNR